MMKGKIKERRGNHSYILHVHSHIHHPFHDTQPEFRGTQAAVPAQADPFCAEASVVGPKTLSQPVGCVPIQLLRHPAPDIILSKDVRVHSRSSFLCRFSKSIILRTSWAFLISATSKASGVSTTRQ